MSSATCWSCTAKTACLNARRSLSAKKFANSCWEASFFYFFYFSMKNNAFRIISRDRAGFQREAPFRLRGRILLKFAAFNRTVLMSGALSDCAPVSRRMIMSRGLAKTGGPLRWLDNA